jgi:hypothetical protein
MTKILEEFLKLSKEEQRNVANELMALVMEDESENDLTPDQNSILQQRILEARKNPESGYSWPEAKALIKNRQ